MGNSVQFTCGGVIQDNSLTRALRAYVEAESLPLTTEELEFAMIFDMLRDSRRTTPVLPPADGWDSGSGSGVHDMARDCHQFNQKEEAGL